jgi:two-component system response regulator PilR (NtrC family)
LFDQDSAPPFGGAARSGEAGRYEADREKRAPLDGALDDGNHEVIVSGSVADAIQRLAEGGIDVVVIDAYDPRGSAVELARHMEALPDTPPIVLVSGSPHAPEISARIGAAAFVPKPVDLLELAAIVNRLAGQARPVRIIDDASAEFEDEDPTGPARQAG